MSRSTLEIVRFDEVDVNQRPRPALGRLHELALAPNALDTQAAARATLGFGLWNHGHLCEDVSVQSTAAWGGFDLPKQNSPLFRQSGMRPGDHAFKVGRIGDFRSAAADPRLQPSATQDFAFIAAIPSGVSVAAASGLYLFLTADFGGIHVYVHLGPGQAASFSAADGPAGGSHSATSTATYPLTEPFVIGGVIERGVAFARVGVHGIVTGTQSIGAQIATGLVDSCVNAGGTYIGLSTAEASGPIAHWMACHGVNAALGVSANLPTILSRYAAAVLSVPSVVDAAAGRGRSFVALNRNVYEGADVVPGSTLATRDCTVQALVKWDLAEQGAAATWKIEKLTADAWDSNAFSVQAIPGDGHVEMAIISTGTFGMLGLSLTDGAVHNTSVAWGWYAAPAGNLYVIELGATPFGPVAYAVDDVLSVTRVGATVRYFKNGVLMYTSAAASSGPLYVDAALYGLGSAFTRINLVSSGARVPITWQNLINVTTTAIDNAGALYARGKGDGAADLLSAGVELAVVNAALGIGEMRWLWHAVDGTLKRQVGGHFTVPPTGYLLLTATRRWVSSTKVVLRYYLAGHLLGEIESTNGSIGGGTTGATTIGARGYGTYPLTAAAMTDASWPGTVWAAGYAFDDVAGNPVSLFGISPLTASGVTYGNQGPRGGADKAIGFDTTTDSLSAGDNFDAGAGDIGYALVVKFSTVITGDIVGKGYAAGSGHLMVAETPGFLGRFIAYDGVDTASAQAPVDIPTNKWVAIMAAMDRSTAQIRFAWREIRGIAGSISPAVGTSLIGNLDSATTHQFGNQFYGAHTGMQIAAAYVAAGVGTCTGLAANLQAAIDKFADTIGGSYGDFFDGTIDELRVLDYELTAEEIAATWDRITKYQPLGYELVKQFHGPGFPISSSPSSKVQRETNIFGQALGFAGAQAENLRANILPDRAYGGILERWQDITKQPSKPGDSVDTRRARVVGKLRARAGVSVPGVRTALDELVATDSDNLEILAFPQEVIEGYGRHDVWSLGDGVLITKTGGATGNLTDNTAYTTEKLTGDGYVEIDVESNVTAAGRVFGFSEAPGATTLASINWALYLISDGTLRAYELGVDKGLVGSPIVEGDILKIERVGTVIRMRKNGAIIYTSAVASTVPILVDVVLEHIGVTTSKIRRLRFYAVEGTAIREIGATWNVVNTTITPAHFTPRRDGVIQKSAGGAAWNAGASSVETIAGDGYVETTAVETNTLRAIGLSVGDTDQNYTDIDYAAHLRADATLEVTEAGVSKSTGTAYAANDVVRIERVGAVVYYKKNGTTFYTSLTPSSGQLGIDASLNTAGPPATLDAVKLVDGGERVSFTWQNTVNVIAVADATRTQAASGLDLQYTGSTVKLWRPALTSISSAPLFRTTTGEPAEGYGANLITKIEPIAIPDRGEVGIAFYDQARETTFLLGLRNDAGTYRIITERIVAGTSLGVTNRAVTSLVGHWLHLFCQAPKPITGGTIDAATWNLTAAWSITGAKSGYTSYAGLAHTARFQWAAIYVRSFGGTLTGALDAYFDETRLFTPYGDRSLYFYAFRDPALAGDPDELGAHGVIQGLKHAHTQATFIESKSLLYDTDGHGHDRGPLGGF